VDATQRRVVTRWSTHKYLHVYIACWSDKSCCDRDVKYVATLSVVYNEHAHESTYRVMTSHSAHQQQLCSIFHLLYASFYHQCSVVLRCSVFCQRVVGLCFDCDLWVLCHCSSELWNDVWNMCQVIASQSVVLVAHCLLFYNSLHCLSQCLSVCVHVARCALSDSLQFQAPVPLTVSLSLSVCVCVVSSVAYKQCSSSWDSSKLSMLWSSCAVSVSQCVCESVMTETAACPRWIALKLSTTTQLPTHQYTLSMYCYWHTRTLSHLPVTLTDITTCSLISITHS